MKITLFALLFIIELSAFSQDNYIVISDFDDTFRITNTTKKSSAAWNAICNKKVFIGMPELYREFENLYDTIHFLSASPSFLNNKVRRVIRNSGIEKFKITLHNGEQSVFDYKYNYIKEIITKYPDKLFILLGDDSGEDHEIYAKIRKDFSDKIARIYIRPVKNKELDKNIYKYYSAFDIAFEEYLAKRFETEKAEIIGKLVLDAKDSKLLFPHYLPAPEIFYVPCCERNSSSLNWMQDQIRLDLSKYKKQQKK